MTAKVWRYSVPNDRAQHEGWAILFLDEAGCFSTLSDYGNYSYRWNASGFAAGERDIRVFLMRCDDGYLMGKLAPEQEYDGDATFKAVKAYILEARHEGRLNADDARAEFELLEDNHLDNEHDFWLWCQDTKLDDYWEFTRHKSSIHAVAFLERAWPRLKKLIEAELESEKQACATT